MSYDTRTLFLCLLLSAASENAWAIFEEKDGPFPREGECNLDDPLFDDVRALVGADRNIGPASLKGAPIPEPSNLDAFVRNRQAAIVLGKALFWDMQVGSDGIQACASCHFRAGADPRSRNQVSPGGKHTASLHFDLPPNTQLVAADFPLHVLADPADRASSVLRSTDDVVSSQGIALAGFRRAERGAPRDKGSKLEDPLFSLEGANTRRVEPRNTPTVINAVFNHRNFWDGRADNLFNGVNELGARDPEARVLKVNGQHLHWVTVRIDNASLASQALGPPVSDFEMGFARRPFREIGKRLVSAVPLRLQRVHGEDSVLGALAHPGRGLGTTYAHLIRVAFRPEWWRSEHIVTIDRHGGAPIIERAPGRPLKDGEYTMMEWNFSLFFGLAIQLYEATLVSDDSKLDRHFDRLGAGRPGLLSTEEERGMALFETAGCAECHSGPELTNASVRTTATGFLNPDATPEFQPPEQIERMPLGNCRIAVYDQGFYNLGVRPTAEDLGLGADDPLGNPLSIARLKTMDPGAVPSQELLTLRYPNLGDLGLVPPISRGERTAVAGAFKVPGLRNVALTAPYFHNGGQRTLREVIEFYNRGGDFHDHIARDGARQDELLALGIGRLELTGEEIDAIVRFLETLTDERVVTQRAPFDHPELFVPDGHFATRKGSTARTRFIVIPAVGRRGGALPPGFLER